MFIVTDLISLKQPFRLKLYLFILVGERMGSETLKRLKYVVRLMYLYLTTKET